MTEEEKLKANLQQAYRIIHDMVTANQAAWIEWQHGRGAEAAMTWIHNGLIGPGHIPDEDSSWGKEAQAYYDANKCDPLPRLLLRSTVTHFQRQTGGVLHGTYV